MIFRSALEKWSQPWVLLFLVLILTIGIFLRTYHFSDWLLFEIDQTYDTRIVSQAVDEGIGHLPLLGPTAGGGRALRLGPAFYYLQYASAMVFGNTPTGHAMLVLLSSLLALPLFYLFCRRYFDSTMALGLLALFAGSAYLVLYGRFSWSPNVLPFLILLSFYALLKSVDSSEPHRSRYFLLATAAISITSQIHFNAFFTIPTIVVLFLLYKRPHFPWKTWLLAVSIIGLIYSPMIMNDVITNGENINFFLSKVGKGGSSNFKSGLVRKTIVDLQYTASGYFLVTTGSDHISGGRLKEYGFREAHERPWRTLALVLFFAELALLLFALFRETSTVRKDFLVLLLLWVLIPFVYFYSLISSGFQIYPRFFLLFAPVAIILTGLLLQKIIPKIYVVRQVLLVGCIVLLLTPSLTRLHGHYFLLSHPRPDSVVETEDIFPDNSRLTLDEQQHITDHLLATAQTNGYPIFISALHEYEPVFWYHLAKHGIPYGGEISDGASYAEGNFFSIKFTTSKIPTASGLTIIDQKNFGVLTVYTFAPDPQAPLVRMSEAERPLSEQTRQIQELTTWHDVKQTLFP
ncbi:MAG: glycosyltransferase family 39 protein [Candidatus Moranbacteria bacterium]|jgi:4-amino-4-deoxy-L-arabinose transferase-like glycosyltransferase|nr:glycosyltransferase family 39 protein [Candidatus Moranbacteria bacterium]